MKRESLGIVNTQYYSPSHDLILKGGEKLKNITIAYETYGKLNKEKSNAIMVCHALSGDAHAAGWHEGDRKPGWWDIIIGPGKALDTNKYFIIKDMVNVQKMLVDHLDIKQLFAVIGGSMGGMQVLQWCISYPDTVRMAIPIATSAYSSPQQIAFNEVGRQAIISDPKWKDGTYYSLEFPDEGLALARMIAHITYLSNESMYEKFGRRLQDKDEYSFDFSTDFQVESYLHYQGSSFTKRFDANTYLYITKAIDYFDLTENGSLADAFKNIKTKFLIISVDSDWLYPPSQNKEILMALSTNDVDVSYIEIKSSYGHDAFLIEGGQLNYIIGNFFSDTLVRDVMSHDMTWIRKDTSIEDAAQLMITEKITHIPVVSDNDKLIGIVTAWDISKAVALNFKNLEEIMTRDVITAWPDDSIEISAQKMKKYNISSLPVVDDTGRVIGIITTDHISTLLAGNYR